jgi:UDP-N-acetylmuramoyl-L-alanyl-D-glutamate--2,6-diaminopimelate ligase
MNLRDLLHGVTAEPVAAVPIAGLACHSKQVRPGDLFVAVPGAEADGHAFIEEAVARGAAAVIAQRPPAAHRLSAGHQAAPPSRQTRPCPHVVVADAKDALVRIAAKFYGHPSRKLRLVGVTGTNGKTTTTYLLKAILESAGLRTGLLGTIAYQIGGRSVPSTNTTPGPLELQRYFAQMAGEGLKWCAMEVSSHALDQGRVAGLEFEAGIFCNLGSDHLDYHKTRDAYAAAKRRLFELLRPTGVAVINADDEYGRVLAQTIPNRAVVSYGVEHAAKVSVKQTACSWRGITLVLDSPWGVVPLATPLLGRHNAWNVAAAATTLLALSVPAGAVRQGLAAVDRIPGRLERIAPDADVNILIDYAHTADALRMALLSLREMTRGRLIVVFGCGGNRDQTKRPVMGKMASLLADYVILTSDNPRGEEPMAIVQQIQAGFHPSFRQFEVVPDREQAILSALSVARRDDTVLIAGKGHETYQLFDHVSVPFSDREMVERWLSGRHLVAVS